jgi:predicted DNA-binding ribbon-helix-helix protein
MFTLPWFGPLLRLPEVWRCEDKMTDKEAHAPERCADCEMPESFEEHDPCPFVHEPGTCRYHPFRPAPVDVPEERCHECGHQKESAEHDGYEAPYVIRDVLLCHPRHPFAPAPTPETMQDAPAPSDFADTSYHFPQLWPGPQDAPSEPAPEGRTHEQVELNRTTSRPAPETMSVEEQLAREYLEAFRKYTDARARAEAAEAELAEQRHENDRLHRMHLQVAAEWNSKSARLSQELAEERQQHARLREALRAEVDRWARMSESASPETFANYLMSRLEAMRALVPEEELNAN